MTGRYVFEVRRYDSPALPHVPVAFLITMPGSTRRAQYLHQLGEFRPCATVVVVHNPGHRRMRKSCAGRPVVAPALDLWHTNQLVARLCLRLRAPVLVLEDDVEFTEAFRELAAGISRDVISGRADAYTLGTVPFVSCGARQGLRVVVGAAAHAVIYTAAARRRLLFRTVVALHDVEILAGLRTLAPRRPCAVQRIGEPTANSRHWDVGGLPSALLCVLSSGDPRTLERFELFERAHRVGQWGGLVVVLVAVVLCVLRASSASKR